MSREVVMRVNDRDNGDLSLVVYKEESAINLEKGYSCILTKGIDQVTVQNILVVR